MPRKKRAAAAAAPAPTSQDPAELAARVAELEAQLKKVTRRALLGEHQSWDDEELLAAHDTAVRQFEREEEFPHDDEAAGWVRCVKCGERWHTDVDGPAWGRTWETVGYGSDSRCVNLVPNAGAPLPRNEAGEIIRQVPMQVCGGTLQYEETPTQDPGAFTVAAKGAEPRRLHMIPPHLGRRGA